MDHQFRFEFDAALRLSDRISRQHVEPGSCFQIGHHFIQHKVFGIDIIQVEIPVKSAGRTAFAYEVWRDGELTQSAVGWVLSCVFIRFLEDNGLLAQPYLSGAGEQRDIAGETRAAYFREHRSASDNDYLAYAVSEVGKLPGMADLMDERHNALWNAAISGDAAKEFIEFWRKNDLDAEGAVPVHDFSDPEWDTRFLGDLYQDLSESARKKYALLQTPDFVEEFILDRTLDPAIDTFGLKEVRMIDPTCGSGHFLLGGFRRLLALWEKAGTRMSERELVKKALDGVYGVDINPFAVAIARFRLLLDAWRYCGVKKLRDAPAFKVNLAVGDSLIHGRRFAGISDGSSDQYFDTGDEAFRDEVKHFFEVEDEKELHRILGQQYHAVVGNPPYITVKDSALNQMYRARYESCYRQYSLSVPFMERLFDLAVTGSNGGRITAGFTGQITANSFMKAEFGKKLINKHIPSWNLTHVIDTSGANIPGHGTPTVIIFGTNQRPASPKLRAALGIKGESDQSGDPRDGMVWNAILDQIDDEGSESPWVSVLDIDRSVFSDHPWSLGGGGASGLKEVIDNAGSAVLSNWTSDFGARLLTRLDDVFELPASAGERLQFPSGQTKNLAVGENVRDWGISLANQIAFPYSTDLSAQVSGGLYTYLWLYRTPLSLRVAFGKTQLQHGKEWFEYSMFFKGRMTGEAAILFSDVSTANHFVIDRNTTPTNSHAPAIFLKKSEAPIIYQIAGHLNSSLACFWIRQVMQGKHKGDGGEAHATPEYQRFELNGTKLKQFPIPSGSSSNLAQELDSFAQALTRNSPEAHTARDAISDSMLSRAKIFESDRRASMISLQEELDWQCYRHYALTEVDDKLEWPEDRLDELPGLTLGQRAFEIRMARQIESGDLESTWFKRHADAGSEAITELPDHWPDDYRALVVRRLAFIEANKNINLIERPEYKRRWNTEPWAKRQQSALRKWLLTRLECYFHDSDRMIPEDEAPESNPGPATEPVQSLPMPTRAERLTHLSHIRGRFAGGSEPKLVSVRQLSNAAQSDPQWMEAAGVYSGREDFDADQLVETLVIAESVPFLPAQRYKASGLRSWVIWERTWTLQREEDKVEARIRHEHEGKSEDELKPIIRAAQQAEVGDIPVPPKYKTGDFQKTTYWSLRGKLDVPKERWIHYPGLEGGTDDSPVIAWAGWDHAQQADALTAFYQQANDTWGWDTTRLAPILAGLKDLLPWLHQWHSELDPEFNDRPSATFQQFYDNNCHAHRLTEDDIEAIRMGDGA